MKATGKLLAAALIAAGSASISLEAQAAEGGAQAPRGDAGTLHGRHGGGHRHHHGHRHWRGHWNWGFYVGAPLFWSAWGWPYYYDDFHYGPRVIYRERIPSSHPEDVMVGPPVATTEVPKGEGAPTRGPLYMNYCESAKAYFPKVTSCPEGWRLATPAG